MTDLYAVDTSVVIWINRNLPRDIYPSVWDAFEKLIAEGRAVMPRDAYEELARVDDYCAPWAKGQAGFVTELDAQELTVVARITDAHPDWIQDQKNAADPFILAQGLVGGRTIVTMEKRSGNSPAEHNLKIPNVADELGVPCINFQELARQEGWRF